MKMFRNCCGECCTCSHGWDYRTDSSCCVAGHGDDEYETAERDVIIERIKNNKYLRYTDTMLEYLGMTKEEFDAKYMKDERKELEPSKPEPVVEEEIDPFKKVEVKINKTIFNPDYWKVGDFYWIKVGPEETRVYFLYKFQSETIIVLGTITHDGKKCVFRYADVSSFLEGSYKVIKHNSLKDLTTNWSVND